MAEVAQQVGSEESEERVTPVRGMATAGRPANFGRPAPLPKWPDPRSDEEIYVPEDEFDVSDLAEVNRRLLLAKARLFRTSRHLKQAQREQIDADLTYRRAFRRCLVAQTGGSAEQRKAMAEIQCEQFENALVVATQVVEEWKKRSQDCRDDLKAIENVAHNVRAQITAFS